MSSKSKHECRCATKPCRRVFVAISWIWGHIFCEGIYFLSWLWMRPFRLTKMEDGNRNKSGLRRGFQNAVLRFTCPLPYYKEERKALIFAQFQTNALGIRRSKVGRDLFASTGYELLTASNLDRFSLSWLLTTTYAWQVHFIWPGQWACCHLSINFYYQKSFIYIGFLFMVEKQHIVWLFLSCAECSWAGWNTFLFLPCVLIPIWL